MSTYVLAQPLKPDLGGQNGHLYHGIPPRRDIRVAHAREFETTRAQRGRWQRCQTPAEAAPLIKGGLMANRL